MRKENAAAERGVADVVALAIVRNANRESLMGWEWLNETTARIVVRWYFVSLHDKFKRESDLFCFGVTYVAETPINSNEKHRRKSFLFLFREKETNQFDDLEHE